MLKFSFDNSSNYLQTNLKQTFKGDDMSVYNSEIYHMQQQNRSFAEYEKKSREQEEKMRKSFRESQERTPITFVAKSPAYLPGCGATIVALGTGHFGTAAAIATATGVAEVYARKEECVLM
jgi:hypothetical protein